MSLVPWDKQVDVIIIGSGFAGLAAAIEAAQAGCSVMVIEKRDFHGGNSWISGGALAAVDNSMQRRHGVIDSTRLMFEDMMKAGRVNNPKLVRLVCMHSFEVLQWLRQDIGVTFMDRLEQLGGHSVPRCQNVPDIQGSTIINKMLARAVDLNINIRLNTHMEAFYQTADKTMMGVGIRTSKNFQRIKAKKATILASGGFSAEVSNTNTSRTSLNDSTSETLYLAEQAGASLIDMEYLQMLPCASPDEQGRGVAPVFASYVIFPYGFMIDSTTGKRFVNEWADRKTRSDAMLALDQVPIGITDQQGLEAVGEMIYDHMDVNVTRRFETLAALADFHQLSSTALQETLQTYNRYVEQRFDDDFGKSIPLKAKPLQAPFYSVRLWPKAHSTMGGVRININAAVLDKKDKLIPRFYAAGEATGGIHGVSRLGCCAITECLVFGRIAGQQAAILEDLEEVVA